MDNYSKLNKDWWNQATTIHKTSGFYGLEDFKNGKSNLNSIELEELGEVKNKTLLHLQCHFGLGTLSWARNGAIVTGVDFSEVSIKLAKELSAEINVPADFICSDLYELPKVLENKFDIVFTSYGVLAWLPDIKHWAQIVSNFVKKGGVFYIAEIHPLTNVFSRDFKISTSYFCKDVFVEEAGPDYADRQATVNATSHTWLHSLADIVSELTAAGLTIEFLHEFPFTVYDQFPGFLEEDGIGYWKFKDKNIEIPLLFSLKANKR